MTKHVLRIPKRYFDASLRVGVRLTSHVIHRHGDIPLNVKPLRGGPRVRRRTEHSPLRLLSVHRSTTRC